MLPGVWRLRLPLDLPGVPHCNAWALRAGGGIVLVDTGMHDRDSMGNLERALDHIGYKLRDVQLVVITHAHIDHCGQAPPIAHRAGCEIWMHPAWKLHAAKAPDLDRTIEVALLSGVPEEPLKRWAQKRRGQGTGQAGTLYADRDLVPGVDDRDRRRHLAGDRDPRPRAVARLPAPARAAPADLGRPPARPRLAVLRHRLHARTRWGSSCARST